MNPFKFRLPTHQVPRSADCGCSTVSRGGATEPPYLNQSNSLRLSQENSNPDKRTIQAAGGKLKGDFPQITGTAYTGGRFRQWWSSYELIIDLTGMKLQSAGKVQILAEHRNDLFSRIGEGTASITSSSVELEGTIVPVESSNLAKMIVEQGKVIPWELSIGAYNLKTVFVDRGETRVVNGVSQSGPFVLVTECTLREISIVALGAALDTVAKIAASYDIDIYPAQDHNQGEPKMEVTPELKAWVIKKYALAATATDQDIIAVLNGKNLTVQTATALMNSEAQPPAPPAAAKTVQANSEPEPGENAAATAANAIIKAQNEAAAANSQRINAISALSADPRFNFDGAKAIINAALKDNTSVDQVELQLLRAAMSAPGGNAPVIHRGGGLVSTQEEAVAALLLSAGTSADDLQKVHKYKEPTIDAAMKKAATTTLQTVILAVAHANGYHGASVITAGNFAEVCQYASIQAGFSTFSLPGIMSDVANKRLLEGFGMIEQTWRQVADVTETNDFKPFHSYRLGASAEFEPVANGGELKHGSLNETHYQNQVHTEGKMYAITRQDVINDDLGALTRMPMVLGQGAGQAINRTFWKEFLDNAAFFTEAAGNLVTSAPLGVDGLAKPVEAFRKLKDESGNLLGTGPKVLLVPPALEVLAMSLFKDTNVIATGAGSTRKVETSGNPWTGKFNPVVSAFLSEDTFTGSSAADYYLLGDPRFRAVIQIAFLFGRQVPYIEFAQASFNTLGWQYRAYLDWGVAKMDPKGGVKAQASA